MFFSDPGTLLHLFILLAATNFLYLLYHVADSFSTISKWQPKIGEINLSPEKIDDEEIDRFEEDIQSSPFISEMINNIKVFKDTLIDKRESLIETIIDDGLMKWDKHINNAANNFIMLGVLFTVLSLSQALPDNFSKFENLEAVNNLLVSFSTAFWTTIYGLILAFLTKVFQALTIKNRKEFRYNFLLFVSNFYSIPEVDEKSLGKLVKSIQRSSKKIEAAALSVEKLAAETNVGTENIERAVSGFSEVTEKMAQREESLNKSLGDLSKSLINIKESHERFISPAIDSMLNELKDSGIQNAANLKSINGLRDELKKLTGNIDQSVQGIAIQNKKLADFFGENFESVINTSIKELSEQFLNKITATQKGIDDIVSEVKKGLNAEKLDETKNALDTALNNIYGEINNIKGPLNNLESLVIKAGLKNSDIDQQCSDMKKDIKSLDSTVSKIFTTTFEIQDKINENDYDSFKDSVEENKELLKTLSTGFNEIKSDIEQLVESINNFPSAKSSGVLGGIANLFKPSNK